jgi:hypothetical protein
MSRSNFKDCHGFTLKIVAVSLLEMSRFHFKDWQKSYLKLENYTKYTLQIQQKCRKFKVYPQTFTISSEN